MSIEYAQDAPYWDTSKRPAQAHQEDLIKVLEKWGVKTYGWMHDDGFKTLYFTLSGHQYKIAVRPLEPRWHGTHNEPSLRRKAEVQAWRLVYHYVKASLELSAWNDPATMVLPFLMLPSGETLSEVPIDSLTHNVLPAPEAVV